MLMAPLSRYKEIILFCVAIIIIMSNAVFFAERKEGFHGDELYSYHFVCNVEKPSINQDFPNEPYLNNWNESAYFRDYFTISTDEAFDVAGVWKSIQDDVHPPLFYILLELTISALFKSDFSKWSGIVLNLLFFFLTLVLLYFFSKRLLRSPQWGLATMFLYGMSIGAVSTTVFIRMYMLLTFVTVCLFYLYYLLWYAVLEEERVTKYAIAGVGVTSFAGIMVHYYFLILVFFASVLILAGFFYKKKLRSIATYCCTMFISLILNLVVWPELYHDMFHGYRGNEAVDRLKELGSWADLIKTYAVIVREELFGVSFRWLGCFMLFLMIGVFIKHNSFKVHLNYRHLVVLQMFLAIIMNVMTIAIVAPYQTDRYIFNILPLTMLVIVFVLKEITEKTAWGRISRILCILGMLLAVLFNYRIHNVNYLYEGVAETRERILEFKDYPAVLITKRNRRFISCTESFYLQSIVETFVTDADGVSMFREAIHEKDINGFLCFIDINLNTDEYVQILSRETGFKTGSPMAETDQAMVFVFSRD